MRLSPGTVVEKYIVEDLLGQGGMAAVYRVRHRLLGSTHALKVLHHLDEAIAARLIREGRLQARLEHPNIVPVQDVVVVDGRGCWDTRGLRTLVRYLDADGRPTPGAEGCAVLEVQYGETGDKTSERCDGVERLGGP